MNRHKTMVSGSRKAYNVVKRKHVVHHLLGLGSAYMWCVYFIDFLIVEWDFQCNVGSERLSRQLLIARDTTR